MSCQSPSGTRDTAVASEGFLTIVGLGCSDINYLNSFSKCKHKCVMESCITHVRCNEAKLIGCNQNGKTWNKYMYISSGMKMIV